MSATTVAADDHANLLRSTEFLDYEAPEIRSFVDRVIKDKDTSAREKAVRLYYAVRDDVFYEVYGTDLSRTGLRASSIAVQGQGFCLHKSVLYAAAVRAVGVPSRLVFGDVRNHLASDRLREHIGGDVFFHALTSVHLDGRWVKATPVFNKMLCRLYGMTPLEFDGTADSLYHPFDGDGRRHMEFLQMHGEFDDLPYEFVMSQMRAKHPKFLSGSGTVASGSLADEAGA
ncbi:transglutaminase-like domain-containing protein [Kitasatospora sp. GP82]|uniref:transglutaminase-like domain-containing protein n=1 Tax=Kitasatospora sp. GP82 TaxID=3035089 RepID=UPI0024767F08|nr:transglutaminase-like domain-containing protein [Kitasatospora sp. GP82]MDH6128153.1 transglutaminase-like putative cysteine protease [Kitasatospora sp. GP82]